MSSPALQPAAMADTAPEGDSEAMPGEAKKQVSQADLEAALAGTISKLQALADKQVQMKALIEQRWLDDLRQFHGRYDITTEQNLKESQKSKLFVNLTRSKTNSWEARLTDLLFPTDDKNWGIQPTPAPHLSAAVQQAMQVAKAAAVQATAAHQGGDPNEGAAIAAVGTSAAQAGASIQDEIEEAEKRAALMEAEIDTQLRASDYNIRARDVIKDMVKLGTGIMKGPVTSQKLKRSWQKVGAATPAALQPANAQQPYDASNGALAPAPTGGADQAPQLPTSAAEPAQTPGAPQAPASGTPPSNVDPNTPGTAYVLNLSPDPAPEFQRVDPWSYFPDMSARTPDEAEFHFERHLWNAKQVRDAVKRVGLNPEAAADLLREAPRQGVPVYWAELREITSNSAMIGLDSRYQVWEFQGVLEDEDLETIAAVTGDQTVMSFVKDNPLLEVPVIIWFCQGRLLKFAPYPLDSCDSLYSVVPFEADDTSMFGFGVPYLMRDSQAAVNGAWRMMMDNGGLSVGPQVVIDNDAVKPADGTWTIRPMKVWLKSSTTLTKVPDSYKPFETFNIGANQAQLQSIITLARDFADDETNMPLIAAGGIEANVTKTASGMSMLMNSANVVFRRVVKNFDDCLSTPNIKRIYDWNMQFNKREDIKGDFNVDARGSSVLLVKEMQAQTLMSSLQNFSNHPVIGPMLKTAALVRKLFQSQLIHADDAVKSDDQIEQEAQSRAAMAASQPQAGDDSATVKMKLDNALEVTRENNQTKIEIANIQERTALITLAQQHNMTLDELQTELQIANNRIAHEERTFAAAAAMEPKGTHIPAEIPA